MTKPRILYYSLLEYRDEAWQPLSDFFDIVELPDPRGDSDEVLAGVDACFAPLGFEFDAAKMERCAKLKAILTNTTGVPHIDMAAAAERGISVFSLKDEQDFLETITPTAEHAFGLLLALTRRQPWAFDAVKQGTWNRFDWGAPAMLSRLDLGIVGLGRLGRKMAEFGQAFGMMVRYYDPYVEAEADSPERIADLGDLIAASDAVTIHAPANDETEDLLDAGMIGRFRPGAVLINTARAELVDEAALLQALEAGRLAGAALDVLGGEYGPDFDAAGHPLVRYAQSHDNLLLTPHIGGSTFDAWSETQRRVVDMAIAYFEEAGG